MKASPLVRAWLARLDRLGVMLHMRHRWVGLVTKWWAAGSTGRAARRFTVEADATVLALGWRKLAAETRLRWNWAGILGPHGIAVRPLQASNPGSDFVDRTRALSRASKATAEERIALSLGGELPLVEKPMLTRTAWRAAGSTPCSRSCATQSSAKWRGVQIAYRSAAHSSTSRFWCGTAASPRGASNPSRTCCGSRLGCQVRWSGLVLG